MEIEEVEPTKYMNICVQILVGYSRKEHNTPLPTVGEYLASCSIDSVVLTFRSKSTDEANPGEIASGERVDS